MLSAHSCLPCEGHLEAACQIFKHIKSHLNLAAVSDSELPHIDRKNFKPVDWTSIHGDVKESRPCKMLPPRGKPAKISMFVDTTHAGDLINRRSQTGVMTFVNSAPVTQHGKRQGTMEASAFRLECAALCIGMLEMKKGMQCKLQMMGAPIWDPSNAFCNNQSVACNSTPPQSQLKKKHLSVCHHCICECCTKQGTQMSFELTETNVANLCTKVSSADRRRKLCKGQWDVG